MKFRTIAAAVLALSAGTLAAGATTATAEPLRVAYWSSGFSLGFGAVLEQEKFLEKEGLEATYRKFSEVAAPAQAVLNGDVDVAFAAPAAAAFNLGQQGAPIRVILATQILEGRIVVPTDSPIKTPKDLAGKKVGMSRPGSSTHAVATTLLKTLYDVQPNDYAVVPGNEGQLAQLIARGDIDAAALRNVTIAQIAKGSVRPIADIVPDWKKMTKGDAPPILAVALTRADVVEKRPEDLAALVKAMRAATAWGSANPEGVAEHLVKAANMDADAARNYAELWDVIYTSSLAPEDVAALKAENRIFVDSGATKGMAPDTLYATGPFEKATAGK